MGCFCWTDIDKTDDPVEEVKVQDHPYNPPNRRLQKMYHYGRPEPKVESDWKTISSGDLTSVEEYTKAVEQLQAAEKERAFDAKITAASSDIEKRAATLVRKIQAYDWDHTYGKPHDAEGNPTEKRTQGEHFLGNVDLVNKTELMKVAKRMPKGAHLHIHWNSCLPARFLIRQARDIKAMYIRSTLPLTTPEHFAASRISFMVMTPYEATHVKGADDDEKEIPLGNIFDSHYVPNRWMSYKQFQEDFIFPGDFGESLTRVERAERWLEHKMLISEEEAHSCKQTGHGNYTRACIKDFVKDNIQHAEIRPNFMSTNSLKTDDGTGSIGNEGIMEIIHDELQSAMDELRKNSQYFGGMKVIYCTPRSFKKEQVAAALDECIAQRVPSSNGERLSSGGESSDGAYSSSGGEHPSDGESTLSSNGGSSSSDGECSSSDRECSMEGEPDASASTEDSGDDGSSDYPCVTQTPMTGGPTKLFVGCNGIIPRYKPGSIIRFAVAINIFPTVADGTLVKEALIKAANEWNNHTVCVTFELTSTLEDAEFVLYYGGNKILKEDSVAYMYNAFLHELGHVLGLRHEFAAKRERHNRAVRLGKRNKRSIMNYHKDLKKFQIQDSDIVFVRMIYGLEEGHKIGGLRIVDMTPHNKNYDDQYYLLLGLYQSLRGTAGRLRACEGQAEEVVDDEGFADDEVEDEDDGYASFGDGDEDEDGEGSGDGWWWTFIYLPFLLMVKPEISVRLLTQKGEWISLSTEYANIRSAADLKKFLKSAWLKEHCDELFKEFNDIKSYVVRNWPGASRLGTATAAQDSMSQARTRSSKSEYSTPQEIGTSFLQERDEYISSLHRVIARARESSASHSLCPPNRAILSIEPKITSKQLSQRRASLERQAPLTTEQQFQQRASPEQQAPRSSKQQLQRRTSLDKQAPRTTKQQMSQERRVFVEAEASITPNQERRASFLREREEYASSLERIIA
ncbi:uncharacterized protein PAC_05624 [Phialocephala subalpina]|uniref:Uncharacterized protein n=1 Tax=Phialocephala subalpina TaxID=576137 RepID=A0A1L7WSK5_9HELO|nr:uncharacterized protein PAC_05624 [Phialocephala subalpina]